jgi:hypothetical protein
VGFLLAASLAVSGLGYILLNPGLASAVLPAGVLLLAFVTSTGITLRVEYWQRPGRKGEVPGCHGDRSSHAA